MKTWKAKGALTQASFSVLSVCYHDWCLNVLPLSVICTWTCCRVTTLSLIISFTSVQCILCAHDMITGCLCWCEIWYREEHNQIAHNIQMYIWKCEYKLTKMKLGGFCKWILRIKCSRHKNLKTKHRISESDTNASNTSSLRCYRRF